MRKPSTRFLHDNHRRLPAVCCGTDSDPVLHGTLPLRCRKDCRRGRSRRRRPHGAIREMLSRLWISTAAPPEPEIPLIPYPRSAAIFPRRFPTDFFSGCRSGCGRRRNWTKRPSRPVPERSNRTRPGKIPAIPNQSFGFFSNIAWKPVPACSVHRVNGLFLISPATVELGVGP